MNVPPHISVTGDVTVPRNSYDEASKDWAEREKIASLMTVPERIVVAGGDTHSMRRSAPQEMIMDQMFYETTNKEGQPLKDVPMRITLDKQEYPDIEEPVNRHEESVSQASIAIDDNPLQELKLMRRQLTKVCSRLYQVEDDLERRRGREMFFGSGIVGLAAVVLFLLFRR